MEGSLEGGSWKEGQVLIFESLPLKLSMRWPCPTVIFRPCVPKPFTPKFLQSHSKN